MKRSHRLTRLNSHAPDTQIIEFVTIEADNHLCGNASFCDVSLSESVKTSEREFA